MEIGNILNDLNSKTLNKYDDINKDYISSLDVNSIFKIESKIIDDLNILKEKDKNLDLIYFNYRNLKQRINKNIEKQKENLNCISMQKEEFGNIEARKKTLYLSKEYNFYKEQTNTKDLINKIKNLHSKIDLLKSDLRDRKLSLEYNKIKEKYNSILIFINSEKFDNKVDVIPSGGSNEEKINWYEKRIEEYIEKQIIFNNYIGLLENYYNEVLEKRISNTNLKELV